MDKGLFITGCFISGCFISVAYYFGFFGTYESLPYRPTIYVEPSKITEKLKRDGNRGIAFNYDYIAYYKNPKPDSEDKSTVYYFALPSKAKSLIAETYYNKDGAH